MVIKDRRDVRSSGTLADSPEEVVILCKGELLPISTHGLSQTPSKAHRPMYERVFPWQATGYIVGCLWKALDPQEFSMLAVYSHKTPYDSYVRMLHKESNLTLQTGMVRPVIRVLATNQLSATLLQAKVESSCEPEMWIPEKADPGVTFSRGLQSGDGFPAFRTIVDNYKLEIRVSLFTDRSNRLGQSHGFFVVNRHQDGNEWLA